MKSYSKNSIQELVRCAKAMVENWPAKELARSVRELDEAINDLEFEHAEDHSRYRIVNAFDRPCEELITELRDDGKLYYVNPKFGARKSFGGMSADESTPVEDFGLTLTLDDDGLLSGKVARKSSVTYANGRPRMWRGSESFSFYPARVAGNGVGNETETLSDDKRKRPV